MIVTAATPTTMSPAQRRVMWSPRSVTIRLSLLTRGASVSGARSSTISSTRSSPSRRWVIRRIDCPRPRRRRRASAPPPSRGRGARSARRGREPGRRRAAPAQARGAGAARPRAASPPRRRACRARAGARRPTRRAARAAAPSISSASVAPGRARSRFSRIVELKTCASWPASANVAADVLLPHAPDVAARRS